MVDTAEKDTAIGILIGFLGTVVGNVTWGKSIEAAGRFVEKKIDAKLFNHAEARGLLEADFASMDDKDTDIFIDRLAKAQEEGTEGRIIRLLNTVPRDPKDGWTKIIKHLNRVDDAKFERLMMILEHDDVAQAVKRLLFHVRERGGQIAREDAAELRKVVALHWDEKAMRVMDDAAGLAAKPIGAFARFLGRINTSLEGGERHE